VPALGARPVGSCKHVMGCPSLPLTAVEDDTDIAPVLKVSTQFSIQVQTAASDYEEKHAYVPVGRSVTAWERASHHGIDGNLKRAGWGVNGYVRIGLGRPRVQSVSQIVRASARVRLRLCGARDGTTRPAQRWSFVTPPRPGPRWKPPSWRLIAGQHCDVSTTSRAPSPATNF